MRVDDMRTAISAVPTLAALDEVAKAFWAAVAAGGISDVDAEDLASAQEARRAALKAKAALSAAVERKAAQGPSLWLHRRVYDRKVSIERRRRLAASGPLPPTLACRFTTAEQAVLRIIGDTVRTKGSCDLTLGEIAARAGCGRTTAQGAVRLAARLGLLAVQERRRPMQRSLPNLIVILSGEWMQWLSRGPRNGAERSRGGGFGKPSPTDTNEKTKGFRGEKLNGERFKKPAARATKPVVGVMQEPVREARGVRLERATDHGPREAPHLGVSPHPR